VGDFSFFLIRMVESARPALVLGRSPMAKHSRNRCAWQFLGSTTYENRNGL